MEVNIPQKIHSRLLGGGRRLILNIQDECGGVHIKFPPEKTISDKVFFYFSSITSVLLFTIFYIFNFLRILITMK